MMKCIPLWIKVILAVIFAVSVASCSNSPKKSANFASGNSRAVIASSSNSEALSRVSPLIKRDYDQALAYIRQNEYTKSEAILKAVIDKAPEIAGPYVNLGIIKLNEGSNEEAEKWFLQAQSRNPKNPEIKNYLGIVYRQQGRFQEAEQSYRHAIELSPMFAKAYLNLGVLYDLYLPNYPAALNNYKQYQTLNPADKQVEKWIVELGQRMQASN